MYFNIDRLSNAADSAKEILPECQSPEEPFRVEPTVQTRSPAATTDPGAQRPDHR